MTTEDNGKDDGGQKEMFDEALAEEKTTMLVSDLPANPRQVTHGYFCHTSGIESLLFSFLHFFFCEPLIKHFNF